MISVSDNDPTLMDKKSSRCESLRQTDKMDSSVARFVLSGLPLPPSRVCVHFTISVCEFDTEE